MVSAPVEALDLSPLNAWFAVYSFMAGFLGLFLLFCLEYLLEAVAPEDTTHRDLLWQERLVARCWAAGLIGLALCLNEAKRWSRVHQTCLFLGIFSGHFGLAAIYAFRLVFAPQHSAGLRLSAYVMFWLLVPNLVGPLFYRLKLKDSFMNDADVGAVKSPITKIFQFHRVLAWSVGLLAIFYPAGFYWLVPYDYASMDELVFVQGWGTEMLVAGSVVHVGVYLPLQSQQRRLTYVMFFCFVTLTTLYVCEIKNLDTLYTSCMTVYVAMSAAYGSVLLATRADNKCKSR